MLHGGKFLHYMGSKRSVTHIVASNLTAKKRIEFENSKVVTPEWIINSIEAGKLLAWQDYALIQNDYKQPKLPILIRNADRENGLGDMDCKNPNFLENFFAKSRFHQLSSWKAELRANFVNKFIENTEFNPPRNSIPIMFLSLIHILCIRDRVLGAHALGSAEHISIAWDRSYCTL